MQIVNKFKQLQLKVKILTAIIIAFSLLSLIILVSLVVTKIIYWNWITGYFLGLVSSLIAMFMMKLAVKQLIKTENHYLYYFMYLLRLGVYIIPFLLAFLLPAIPFYFVGVIIGLVPIILFPFLQKIFLKQEIKNSPKMVLEDI